MTAGGVRSVACALAALAAHWRRRPGQLLAMAAGLAAATALWSGVQALNAEARASYARASGALSAQGESLTAADGGPVAQETYVALRRAGWPVTPAIEGAIAIDRGPVSILGIDLLTAGGAGRGDFDMANMGGLDAAAFLTPPGRAWMAPDTMRRHGLREGDTPQTADGAMLPPVSARQGVATNTAVMDVGAAQAVLGMEGSLTRLMMTGPPSLGAPPWEDVAPDLRRVSGADPDELERLTASFHLNLTAFGLLAFLVGLFIVYAAGGLAFEQRLPAIRTIRACGVSRRALAAALATELLVLALAAGVAGVALGYVIASGLLPGVSLTLRSLYGAPAPGSLAIRPEWWVSGLGMSVLGAAVALGVSLAKAWRLPVLAPTQPVTWMQAQRRWARVQAAAGLTLLAGCAAILSFGSGLASGFAAMAALLLGAALLLPPALSLLLGLAERSAHASAGASPIVEWFWADARREMSGVSLALMALLLALGTNIGVGSMVGGFRTVFESWLDQRLAADLYLNVPNPGLLAEAEAILRAAPGVEAVLPTGRVETQASGWPVEVEGLTDHALYRDSWPILGGAADWDAVARGDAALISEQTARRLGLRRGDVLTLPAPTGDWNVAVAGIYSDYGNPRGQATVALDALLKRWPEASADGLEIVANEARAADASAALRARFGPALGLIMDQRSIKALSLSIFERTFAVTAALNVLTLTVAGVALLASLATLAQRRLPQLAPVWALGATRQRLAALELGKTLALAALTALLAVPLGVALAWLLVTVINVEAFGWRLPLHMFPLQWLLLFGLALLAALLAGAGPALQLARVEPARLASVFASER